SGDDEYVVASADATKGDASLVKDDGRWYVWLDGLAYEFDVGPVPRKLGAASSHLDAPLPGQVIAVRVRSGDHVAHGDELVVVEAMKMEHAIRAPSDGTIRSVLCAPGDQVQ